MSNDTELPGMLALAKGVAEGKWPHSMDAQVWADVWLKSIAANPEIPTDRECMIGWFANAIMAGYDQATHTRQQAVNTGI